MIGFFRRHQTWILWTITAGIIVTMLPWGTVSWSAIFSNDGSPEVGTILDETVTLRDLQKQMNVRSNAPPEEIEASFWQLAILRYAESQGFAPAQETVEAYARAVHGRRPGTPSPETLAFARHQMAVSTLQRAIELPISGSDLECYDRFLEVDGERQAKYAALKTDTLSFLAGDLSVTEEEIRKEYDRLKLLPGDGPEPGFRTDETIRLELAFLARASIATGITITDDEARAEYDRLKETVYRKTPPEGVENPASTPVADLPPPAHTPFEEVSAAIKERLARERVSQALSGKLADAQRFTSDAASHPEDIPGVARRFGMSHIAEAGPLARKDLAKVEKIGDLSAAASRLFSAPRGAILTAEVPDGGLLYRLIEKIPAGSLPLEEVSPKIRERLLALKGFEKVKELAQEIQRKADEFSLETAVQQKLDQWKKVHVFSEPPVAVATTEFFKARDASVTGVGSSPEFRRQTFTLAPPLTDEERRKKPGLPEGPKHAIALDETTKTAFVLTPAAARPPDPRGFAARKEELRREMIGIKQEVLLENIAESLKNPEIAEFTYTKDAASR